MRSPETPRDGTLRRNFQGYTTDTGNTLLGFGASAIGQLPQGYVQNEVGTRAYSASIANGRLATVKGYALTDDDRLRAEDGAAEGVANHVEALGQPEVADLGDRLVQPQRRSQRFGRIAGGTLAAASGLRAEPGIVSLATASRRRVEPEAIWTHTQRLPSGAAVAVEERPAGGDGGGEHGGEEHGDGIHMPSPSYFPFILALGLPILGYAAVFQALWLVPIGAVVVLFGMYAWGIEPQTEP